MAGLRQLKTAWLLACLCTCLAAGEDQSCLLQTEGRPQRKKHSGKPNKTPRSPRYYYKTQDTCGKAGTAALTFDSYTQGDKLAPDAIRGVTITTKSKKCSGPPTVLDSRVHPLRPPFNKCRADKTLLVLDDDKTKKVVACGEKHSFSFEFWKVQTIVSVDLQIATESVIIKLFGDDGFLRQVQAPPPGPQTTSVNVPLDAEGVRKMIIQASGQIAVRQITACRPEASVFGDPHVYTLDGDKFDFYENGTFSVFHYAGQKLGAPSKEVTPAGDVDWQLYAHYGGPYFWAQGLLLVDRSNGRFRQALELTAGDCQWRRKLGDVGEWADVLDKSPVSLMESEEAMTSFQFYNPKHINLRMRTAGGVKDNLVLNTVCKPKGINVRVSMPDLAESRFLQGQIEVGNGQGKNKYQVEADWAQLGGSTPGAAFLQKVQEQSVAAPPPCKKADKVKAEELCVKHLGAKAREENPDFFDDCVSDVCRGGEEFAIAAAEMLNSE
mmetsp:Transcript_19861/g.37377  ORF Transcript_19861/g.37377 Transcript_19861/m.37377 type:complete len:494 (-) Transcript_19861:77-1558(-)